MKETRLIMGMPIAIEIAEEGNVQPSLDAAFDYFTEIDERFSTYKEGSEISNINRGEIVESDYSPLMKEAFALGEQAHVDTDGYFDIHRPAGGIDPSGVVKGWAIKNAAALLFARGHRNFMIDGAGDIASLGKNAQGSEWSIGIRNPFNREEVVKIIYPHEKGVATSGSAIRGAHIYNPRAPNEPLDEIVSVTVIARDVLTADLFATATFAMGRSGISFLENHPDLEGYAIDRDGIATMTSGFPSYTSI